MPIIALFWQFDLKPIVLEISGFLYSTERNGTERNKILREVTPHHDCVYRKRFIILKDSNYNMWGNVLQYMWFGVENNVISSLLATVSKINAFKNIKNLFRSVPLNTVTHMGNCNLRNGTEQELFIYNL
jgi:hypothetical protein